MEKESNGGKTGIASRQGRSVTFDVSKLPLSNPDNIRPVYTNFAGIAQTPWDFQIMFSEMVVAGQNISVQLRSLVVMTPHHAKALLGVLQANIAEFEKSHGEIKWQKQDGKAEG